jgi:hypothetical protein
VRVAAGEGGGDQRRPVPAHGDTPTIAATRSGFASAALGCMV